MAVPAGAPSRLVGVHFAPSRAVPVNPSYRVLCSWEIVSVSSERFCTRCAHAPFSSSEAHSAVWPVTVGWIAPVGVPASTEMTSPVAVPARGGHRPGGRDEQKG